MRSLEEQKKYDYYLAEWRKYVASNPNALLTPENPKDYPTLKDFHRERGIPYCEQCGEAIGQKGWVRLPFQYPHIYWNRAIIIPCPKCNGGPK